MPAPGDVTKKPNDVTTAPNDALFCVHSGKNSHDSNDYSKLFSKLSLEKQESLLFEAFTTFSAHDLSRFATEDFCVLSKLKSETFNKTPDNYIFETLQDSVKQSTPNQSSRKTPSKRFRPRSEQRSYRAARYDFKTAKVVDISLASTTSTNLSADMIRKWSCTNSYKDTDVDTDVDTDSTLLEVLKHQAPPTKLDRYFQTVFSSPIAKVDSFSDVKETSTSDLRFTCSSQSCVKCPEGILYTAESLKGTSVENVEVGVAQNLPVMNNSSFSEERSAFNPLDLSKSPYRPLSHIRASLPKRLFNSMPKTTILNKIKAGIDKKTPVTPKRGVEKKTPVTPKSGIEKKTPVTPKSGVGASEKEEGKENVPSQNNTFSFHRNIDNFITELEELQISDLEMEQKTDQYHSQQCSPKFKFDCMRQRRNQISSEMENKVTKTSRGILHELQKRLIKSSS